MTCKLIDNIEFHPWVDGGYTNNLPDYSDLRTITVITHNQAICIFYLASCYLELLDNRDWFLIHLKSLVYTSHHSAYAPPLIVHALSSSIRTREHAQLEKWRADLSSQLSRSPHSAATATSRRPRGRSSSTGRWRSPISIWRWRLSRWHSSFSWDVK